VASATSRQRGGLPIRRSLLRRSDIFRLDAHSVVDCDGQFLFAPEVTLCCLDRDVSEQQELDLIEFGDLLIGGAFGVKRIIAAE